MNIKNSMLYKKTLRGIPFMLSSISALSALTASAQATTTLLQPNAFPGVAESTANLPAFLGAVFNYGIAIAVVLALIMIIVGGIELMTTDSWTGKEAGKQKIWDAFLGLGLALVSWLLLYIINPNLVTFNANCLVFKC
jgi:hypothetical protein